MKASHPHPVVAANRAGNPTNGRLSSRNPTGVPRRATHDSALGEMWISLDATGWKTGRIRCHYQGWQQAGVWRVDAGGHDGREFIVAV